MNEQIQNVILPPLAKGITKYDECKNSYLVLNILNFILQYQDNLE